MNNIVPKFSPQRTVLAGEKTGLEQLLKRKIEWEEKLESHIFRVNLSGFRTQELKISVDLTHNKSLSIIITAEKCMEILERLKNGPEKCVQRKTRGLRKSFQLPDGIMPEKMTARFEEGIGILTISVPKEASTIMPSSSLAIQVAIA